MTNGDRIRSMSNEKLAHFCELIRFDENNEIPFCKNKKECEEILDEGKEIPGYMCEKCMQEWLEREEND